MAKQKSIKENSTKKGSTKKQPDKFWKEKEVELKDAIGFRTYASFLGEVTKGKSPVAEKYLGKPPSDKGGLLYGVANVIYFEDFEKKSTLASMVGGTSVPWEKTEFSFSLDEVAGIRSVSEVDSRRSIQGKISPESLTSTEKGSKNIFHSFTRYFCIELKEGKFLFFEVLEKKDFLEFIQKSS